MLQPAQVGDLLFCGRKDGKLLEFVFVDISRGLANRLANDRLQVGIIEGDGLGCRDGMELVIIRAHIDDAIVPNGRG